MRPRRPGDRRMQRRRAVAQKSGKTQFGPKFVACEFAQLRALPPSAQIALDAILLTLQTLRAVPGRTAGAWGHDGKASG